MILTASKLISLGSILIIAWVLIGCEAGGELDNTRYANKSWQTTHDASPADSCASSDCHNANSGSTYKPASHPATSESCGACHFPTAWLPLIVPIDHKLAFSPCSSCHNSSSGMATDKPLTHIATLAQCNVCHTTVDWLTTTAFDHTTVVGQACADSSCHIESGTLTYKPIQHPISSNLCDICHVTTAWLQLIVPMDHSQTTDACSNCHDDNTATGKTATHPSTSNMCVVCHVNSGWLPVITPFDHTQSNEPSCRQSGCHYDSDKSVAHVVTVDSCEICHASSTVWTVVVNPS